MTLYCVLHYDLYGAFAAPRLSQRCLDNAIDVAIRAQCHTDNLAAFSGAEGEAGHWISQRWAPCSQKPQLRGDKLNPQSTRWRLAKRLWLILWIDWVAIRLSAPQRRHILARSQRQLDDRRRQLFIVKVSRRGSICIAWMITFWILSDKVQPLDGLRASPPDCCNAPIAGFASSLRLLSKRAPLQVSRDL